MNPSTRHIGSVLFYAAAFAFFLAGTYGTGGILTGGDYSMISVGIFYGVSIACAAFGKLFQHMSDLQATAPQRYIDISILIGKISVLSIFLAFIAISAFSYINTKKFLSHAQITDGHVIDYRTYEKRNDNGGETTMYQPIIEYKVHGTIYQTTLNHSTSWIPYELGERLELLYDERYHGDIHIKENDPYIFTKIFGIASLIPLLLGIIFHFITRKQLLKQKDL